MYVQIEADPLPYHTPGNSDICVFGTCCKPTMAYFRDLLDANMPLGPMCREVPFWPVSEETIFDMKHLHSLLAEG